MQPVKQKLQALLAQAKGTRWDVLACRACGLLSVVSGLGQYAGFIPGHTGAIVAGVSGGAAALLPRATKAAGLLTTAYDQKTPFLKILPQIIQTLLSAPKINADAKSQAEAQAQAEAAAQNEAKLRGMVDAMETRLKQTGIFTSGTGPGNLSSDVPQNLSGDVPQNLSGDVPEALRPAAKAEPTLTDSVISKPIPEADVVPEEKA